MLGCFKGEKFLSKYLLCMEFLQLPPTKHLQKTGIVRPSRIILDFYFISFYFFYTHAFDGRGSMKSRCSS